MNFSSIQNVLVKSFVFFEDQLTSSLTAQQKKVALIALTIFSACATSVMIYQCFIAKKNNSKETDQESTDIDFQESLTLPVDSPDHISKDDKGIFVLRNLVAHINKGQFEHIDPKQTDYIIENGHAYESARKAPEYTGNPHFKAISFRLHFTSDYEAALNEKVMQIYNQAIKDEIHSPGAFGDIIKMIQLDPYTYVVTEIAERSFPKPGIASDLVTIFKTQEGYMFVGIIRDREPGLDKPAIVGGFTGIEPLDKKQPASINNRKVLDAPLYTALKEGKEEGNLRIEVPNIKDYREDYNLQEIEGKFVNKKNKEQEVKARIINLGCFKTGDDLIKNGGELLNNGSKRVYITHGFLCYADMSHMTMDQIKEIFDLKANDDAKALFITQLNSEEDVEAIQFGIQHHPEILSKAFTVLKEIDNET